MFGNGLKKIGGIPSRAEEALPGSYLSECFVGKTTHHTSIIAGINDVDGIKALWHAAQAEPLKMRTPNGMPFAWTEDGVTYRSDCFAFEKNMAVITDALHNWNKAVTNYDSTDPRTFISEYARPSVLNLNHLIQGGGLGDYQSQPRDAKLLPKVHQVNFLKNIRDGFLALYVYFIYSASVCPTYNLIEQILGQSSRVQ